MIAGIGHDLVNVAQFAEQMQDGNGWRALFLCESFDNVIFVRK